MDNAGAINAFFDAYAERFNRFLKGEELDLNGTLNAFATCFLEASPMGVMCGVNDERFREMVPKGYAFYKSIGITSMDILARETTMLNELHFMTRVRWNSRFIRKDNTSGGIEFEVIYFTQLQHGLPKIFAYITGDEQKALKAEGLI
jgi:hypothetical protein